MLTIGCKLIGDFSTNGDKSTNGRKNRQNGLGY
jgi:hypothetical protein